LLPGEVIFDLHLLFAMRTIEGVSHIERSPI